MKIRVLSVKGQWFPASKGLISRPCTLRKEPEQKARQVTYVAPCKGE